MILNKKPVRFGEACKTCPRQYDCLSATSIAAEPRKFFIKMLGKRQETTPAMLKGKANHELFQKNLKDLTTYGFQKFHKDLLRDKSIILKEAMVCSPRYGLRGFIDIASFSLTRDNKMNVLARELKSGWTTEYLYQMATYGMILSDKDAFIHYVKKGKKKERKIPIPLYPIDDFTLSVDTSIEIFRKSKEGNMSLGKPFKTEFIKKGLVGELANGLIVQVHKRAKQRRRMMQQQIFFMEDLPVCKFCQKDATRCGFPEICGKINTLQHGKTQQVYFGKNKLLVTAKPKVMIQRQLPMKREG